ncbi:oxidoreductase, aldo/keto reductase family protein [Gleimia coleocanis DSM 15436]|uniref:Oxidoreductase, aldo/keto reductase family protein n=1 Tax=Gleimia coleocanis DSM 15436 TaxID=525245 RepID=C0W0L0_9ACTO|nr:aldo/keto reductase [Gleimia coleocanis]EEH64069.1 oxidoreductase, aldo/keto reductase family protein [Gleimia coleocanis DSM 15436]
MQQRFLGSTGLPVSSLGLGTLTWGRDTSLDEARQIWRVFNEFGGNLLDTSPTYGEGQAESVIGSLLASDFSREETILVSKGGFYSAEGALRAGNHRNAVLNSLDRTLKALGTDYLDVYLLSRPDVDTPLEESLAAVDVALRSGRIRYFGISNFSTWDTATALAYSRSAMSAPLAVVEGEYSLLNRQAELELLPALEANNVGFIAWSGLARGVLTGKYRHSTPSDSRGASPTLAGFVQPYLGADSVPVVEALMTAAKGLELAPWDVALAWLQAQPGVTSALVGPRTEIQAQQLFSGADLTVPGLILQALDEVSEF